MAIYDSIYPSPIGPLSILFDDAGRVYMLHFGIDYKLPKSIKSGTPISNSEPKGEIKSCLDDFFAGKTNAFDGLELIFDGTDFQKSAWNELRKIPYGATISYQEQCTRAGSPKALRAIGQANNKNPIAIIIPCHRVIGKNGKMTGFGGGIDIKEKLLMLEKGVAI